MLNILPIPASARNFPNSGFELVGSIIWLSPNIPASPNTYKSRCKKFLKYLGLNGKYLSKSISMLAAIPVVPEYKV